MRVILRFGLAACIAVAQAIRSPWSTSLISQEMTMNFNPLMLHIANASGAAPRVSVWTHLGNFLGAVAACAAAGVAVWCILQ